MPKLVSQKIFHPCDWSPAIDFVQVWRWNAQTAMSQLHEMSTIRTTRNPARWFLEYSPGTLREGKPYSTRATSSTKTPHPYVYHDTRLLLPHQRCIRTKWSSLGPGGTAARKMKYQLFPASSYKLLSIHRSLWDTQLSYTFKRVMKPPPWNGVKRLTSTQRNKNCFFQIFVIITSWTSSPYPYHKWNPKIHSHITYLLHISLIFFLFPLPVIHPTTTHPHHPLPNTVPTFPHTHTTPY